ncbi:AraC family transcriptional regulator [Acinetobacter stercoris]|uniref:HTH-type transcriptional repressor of iron proteins A n=1 Tax=Acinetobacter stercoris TaxID=2126983 RepID=A0A2U3N1X6_9GAMM|nr:helix-turn-helix transcriptional regulator [Acinetobacter stercoris]SPL71644.1 HTH-type transcriptional repressor of iron proteins A [Acinetobacter stercoris]
MKRNSRSSLNYQQIATYDDIPAALWFRVSDAPAESIYPQHAHAWGEFIYSFNGVLEVNIDQINYLTPPPYGLWLPPNLKHSGLNRTQVTHCTLYVHENLCQDLPQHAGILMTNAFVPAILEHLRCSTLPDHEPEHLRILQVLLDQLKYAQILGSYLPSSKHPALIEILDFFHQHPDDSTSLKDLARQLNMTERTLARYSQKELGMSLNEWRQRLKVMNAMSMLNTNKTVESIALDLGYANSSAFISMFKRWMNLTPDQFRKLYKS